MFALVSLGSYSMGATISSLSRLDNDLTPFYSESLFTLSVLNVPVYIDYSFTYSSFPSYLNGAETVRMENGDHVDQNYQLQLVLSTPATVYLLIDDRVGNVGMKMPWVAAGGFQDTGDNVMVWEFPYSVFAANVSAGTITVREQNEGNANMYVVAAVPEPSTVSLLGGAALFGFVRRRENGGR